MMASRHRPFYRSAFQGHPILSAPHSSAVQYAAHLPNPDKQKYVLAIRFRWHLVGCVDYLQGFATIEVKVLLQSMRRDISKTIFVRFFGDK